MFPVARMPSSSTTEGSCSPTGHAGSVSPRRTLVFPSALAAGAGDMSNPTAHLRATAVPSVVNLIVRRTTGGWLHAARLNLRLDLPRRPPLRGSPAATSPAVSTAATTTRRMTESVSSGAGDSVQTGSLVNTHHWTLPGLMLTN